jgi:hypothetical protein
MIAAWMRSVPGTQAAIMLRGGLDELDYAIVKAVPAVHHAG